MFFDDMPADDGMGGGAATDTQTPATDDGDDEKDGEGMGNAM